MILRRDRAAAMPFIMAATLIDMITIGLIIPVLPALVGGFTGSQANQAFWYGAVTFAFGIANFFSSPILGALSDAHGRRPVLLLGFCGLAVPSRQPRAPALHRAHRYRPTKDGRDRGRSRNLRTCSRTSAAASGSRRNRSQS